MSLGTFSNPNEERQGVHEVGSRTGESADTADDKSPHRLTGSHTEITSDS